MRDPATLFDDELRRRMARLSRAINRELDKVWLRGSSGPNPAQVHALCGSYLAHAAEVFRRRGGALREAA